MKLVSKIFQKDNWYVTSPFGYREVIKTKAGLTSSFHNGCDYGTYGEKWNQYAIENGKIIDCGTDRDGANYILVSYPRINIKLLHYHLDRVMVSKGQSVHEGSLLGATGSTGKATEIHLHLGLIDQNNNYIDPHKYEYNNEIKNRTYTVKIGDNLSSIAKRYNTSWEKIYQENKEVIGDDPNLILPGQKLII